MEYLMKKLFLIILTLGALSTLALAEVPFDLKSFKLSQKRDEKILLHFHANWCPTCRVQKKVLAKLDSEGSLNGVTIYSVDYDKEPTFNEEMNVTQQSTFITFYGALETGRVGSLTSESDIKNFISDKLQKLTLSDQLRLMKAASASKVPPEVAKIMSEATEKLKKSHIAENTLKVGQSMPSFSLPDFKGKKVSLKESLKNGPVIISFYRGSWCPYCNAQLNSFQQHLADFKQKGATLIAISPEKPDLTAVAAENKKLEFPILTDKDNKFAKKIGLVFGVPAELKAVYKKFGIDLEESQGNSDWNLPMPATYVVSKKGKIIYAFVDADYTLRATAEDVLNALAKTK
jgi:peroxiredoxin